MKFLLILLVLVATMAWAIQKDDQMEVKRRSDGIQDFMNYIGGFPPEGAGFSNDGCNYFSDVGLFSNNPDVIGFSTMLNSWMCNYLSSLVWGDAVDAINLLGLTQAFLAASEKGPPEKAISTTTEVPSTTTHSIKPKMVLYVGNSNSNPEIDVYVWSSARKNLEKRTSVAIKYQSNCLVTDKTGNLLISLDNCEEVKQQLEVFDLKGGMDKPQLLKSTEIDNTNFGYAAVHSSGKYLMLTEYEKNEVFAMEIMTDGSLRSGITITQPTINDGNPDFIQFHPKATDVLLVVYSSAEKAIFYRFDSAKVSLEPVSTKEEVNSAACISLTDDGQYMYVLTTRSELLTIKITVDVVNNDVTNLEEQDRFNAVDSSSKAITFPDMVITPSSKFLYILTYPEVIIFAINPPTRKPSPNGFFSLGGGDNTGYKMVVSPDGTHLVVSKHNKGIVVLSIKEDGKLELLSEFKYTNAPNALFYTWMHQPQ